MMPNHAEKITIEEKCPKCHGSGKINLNECPECKGKGVVLTETGKVLLKYLEDSIRLSEH